MKLDSSVGNLDDDFHLQLISLGVSVGDTGAMARDLFDQNGNADSTKLVPCDLGGTVRINVGKIDIGPYEIGFF